MRLLYRQDGELQFTPFQPPKTPYAILSHRALPDEDEVSYDNVLAGGVDKLGSRKIQFCLDQAERDGYRHVWIDSCCIDRASSQELSESLNSMYKWYAEAAVCYVYLPDVTKRSQLKQSEWFTRAWTLQELIAPHNVQFFSSDGQCLGDKHALSQDIAVATKLGPMTASIPERFGWSLSRRATRSEDMSYSMLGLLRVHLLPNYGEGGENARRRLIAEAGRTHGEAVMQEMWAQIHMNEKTQSFSSAPGQTDQQARLKSLLDSLSFPEMNSRFTAIPSPIAGTCEWILQHPEYRTWSNAHGSRFLWIKSKAGAGKSTLMKFANSDHPQASCVSFYFNARGTQLEHSTVGLYRSFLYQLLQKADYMQSTIEERLTQVHRYTGASDWTLDRLQDILQHAILNLRTPIHCFIDALDECNDEQARGMVDFLDDLSHRAPLYVCFASRPYPVITIRSPQILLEEQHEHDSDIETFVRDRLNAEEELQQEVIRKANGVFLWAVLVVQQMNIDIDNAAVYNLWKTLDRLPGQLNTLLLDIAERQDELPRFRASMQLMLHSTALTADMFCANLLMMIGSDDPSTVRLAERIVNGDVSQAQIETWVPIWSRGLGEVVSHTNRLYVQIIHEAVHEFFIRGEGRSMLYDSLHQDPIAHVHDEIKDAYHKCSSLTFSNEMSWRKTRTVEDILFAIFRHAAQAAKAIDQVNFTASIGSGELERLCVQFEVEFVSIWFQMIEWRSPELIESAGRVGLNPNTHYRPSGSTPLIQAVISCDYAVVEALLACGADVQMSDSGGRMPLHLSMAANLEIVEILLDYGAFANDRDQQQLTALHVAAWRGAVDADAWHFWYASWYGLECKLPKYDGLLDYTRLREADDLRWRIMTSAYTGTLSMPPGSAIELLLRYGADPTAIDDRGRTPLMLAATASQCSASRILFEAGADKDALDYSGRSALMYACAAGASGSVEYLLTLGSDSNQVDLDGRTPLLANVKHEATELSRLIAVHESPEFYEWFPEGSQEYLDSDYPVDSEQSDYHVVQLLLSQRASLNERDERGSRVLPLAGFWARCHKTVKLLLEHGANTETKDEQGHTALKIAIDGRLDDVAILLITHGADLYSIDPQTGKSVLDNILDRRWIVCKLAYALRERGAIYLRSLANECGMISTSDSVVRIDQHVNNKTVISPPRDGKHRRSSVRRMNSRM